MPRFLSEYYRIPDGQLPAIDTAGSLSARPRFFAYGNGITCFGKSSVGPDEDTPGGALYDVSRDILARRDTVSVPFDPDELVRNLTQEEYLWDSNREPSPWLRSVYYAVRPLLPLGLRSRLQHLYFRTRGSDKFPQWPVDTTVDALAKKLLLTCLEAGGISAVPFIWFWPKGRRGCAVMTHDVETADGLKFCKTLMDADAKHRIPASFQIIPEDRYAHCPNEIAEMRSRGFEVNVHDLNHDGRLFWDYDEFSRRAAKINQYAREMQAVGFRSAILYRRQEWYSLLEVEYDMSIPNVGHLDPQEGGCCTVKPFFIDKVLELPLTTSQDHTVFHIIRDYSLKLWRTQIELILKENGLASFIIHPDYVAEPRAYGVFLELLEELDRVRADRNVWVASPGEVNRWWRMRAQMSVVRNGSGWAIEGPGKENAVLAFASVQGGNVEYEVPEMQTSS